MNSVIFKYYIVLSLIVCLTISSNENVRVTRQLVTEKQPETMVSPYATRGMVIDAGSGGSRLHIFRWEPRIFKTVPPPISYPTSDEKWTNKIRPGIAELATSNKDIKDHIIQLLHFAKVTLADQKEDFDKFPIFFKATGGMRQIPLTYRKFVMKQVRSVLSNKTLCPFYFSHDMARVISGEEEAIYSWAAVNFLFDNLVHTVDNSQRPSTYGGR